MASLGVLSEWRQGCYVSIDDFFCTGINCDLLNSEIPIIVSVVYCCVTKYQNRTWWVIHDSLVGNLSWAQLGLLLVSPRVAHEVPII